MFDRRKFKAALALKGLTIRDVAAILSIDVATLYRKMNGTSDFYRNEIQILCTALELKNPEDIFFAKELT